MIVMFGLSQCDTVAAARAWLAARGIAYRFIDLRKAPPERAKVAAWCAEVGWQTLLNRRGTTWKNLDSGLRDAVVDEASAVTAMTRQPTMMRRPIVETTTGVIVGFDQAMYGGVFAE